VTSRGVKKNCKAIDGGRNFDVTAMTEKSESCHREESKGEKKKKKGWGSTVFRPVKKINMLQPSTFLRKKFLKWIIPQKKKKKKRGWGGRLQRRGGI